MSSHVLSSPYCVVLIFRSGKHIKEKPFMSNSGFFSSKFKKDFWDVEHFWMTSAVLSEAALLWSIYVLSVAAVSPQRIRSSIVRLPGFWLNLSCLSLHVFFSPPPFFFYFSSSYPILCHCITSHFLLSYADLPQPPSASSVLPHSVYYNLNRIQTLSTDINSLTWYCFSESHRW